MSAPERLPGKSDGDFLLTNALLGLVVLGGVVVSAGGLYIGLNVRSALGWASGLVPLVVMIATLLVTKMQMRAHRRSWPWPLGGSLLIMVAFTILAVSATAHL